MIDAQQSGLAHESMEKLEGGSLEIRGKNLQPFEWIFG
jgi:hypothetical protein